MLSSGGNVNDLGQNVIIKKDNLSENDQSTLSILEQQYLLIERFFGDPVALGKHTCRTHRTHSVMISMNNDRLGSEY